MTKHSGQPISHSTRTCNTVDIKDCLVGLIAALPLMHFAMYVAHRLFPWLGILQKIEQKLTYIFRSLQRRWRCQNFRQKESCDEEQLSHRIVNPCEYQPLLQNRDKDEDGSKNDKLSVGGAYINDYGFIH